MTNLRQQIIDVLLATSGQSEGVTADAILSLIDALREERDRLRDRVAELEDYIQRTPEALGCRYGGECDYKNPAVISKIEADAVRNCASEIADKVANLENDSAQSVWKTFQDWIEQRANQLESGQ